MEEVLHDTSHVDDWLRTKRVAEAAAANAAARAVVNDSRARYAHALWRPLLAGAAGAALIIGAVYVALPKFIPHTIDIDRVVLHDRDVIVDHVVPRDVVVDHVVPRDVPAHGPKVSETVQPPPAPKVSEAAAPPPPTPKAPMSETDFRNTPEWKNSSFKGRIIRQQANGFVLTTDDGQEKIRVPIQIDANGKVIHDATGQPMVAPDLKFDVTGHIGDLATCYEVPGEVDVTYCYTLTNGQEFLIPSARTTAPTPTPPINCRDPLQSWLCPNPVKLQPPPPRAARTNDFSDEDSFRASWGWQHAWLRGRVIDGGKGPIIGADDHLNHRSNPAALLHEESIYGRLAYCDHNGSCWALWEDGRVTSFVLGKGV
jgi:hypothetical protein